MRKVLVLASLVLLSALATAQVTQQAPSTDYFLPVTTVGSNASGTPVPFYGCTQNGATLQNLSLWANDQWIRGIQATLTNGQQVLYGCLNVTGNQTGNGCGGANIRNANFSFQPAERIVNLTLWPGYNQSGVGNSRAGAIAFSTSLGRSFDFGMTTRQNASNVSVGGGIPCGIAPKAGADIDALGIVFLRDVTANSLQNIQYSGVAADSGGASTDVAPLSETSMQLILSNQTFNNSGKSTSLVATPNSQRSLTTASQWTNSPGLDSYLLAPIDGATPQITSSSNASYTAWQLGSSGLHSRNESQQIQEAWNYTLTVGPQGVSQILATAAQGNITATYMARLNVTLSSGAVISVPVSGIYQGLSVSPVNVKVMELVTAVPQSSKTDTSKGHDNTVAWVVGVLVGLVGGLVLAALLAWAIVIIMRRRHKQAKQDDTRPPSAKNWPYMPAFKIPAFVGKGKGTEPKDVELGPTSGKGSWYVNKDDKSESPAVGFPVSQTGKEIGKDGAKLKPEEGELPEVEGKHVMPYNLFRRLRLDSLRRQLDSNPSTPSPKLEQRTPVGRMGAQIEELEKEELSNPNSGASTPRTLPEAGNQDSSSSSIGAESIVNSRHPDIFGGGPVMEDEKVALRDDRDDAEPKKLQPKTSDEKRQLRDQVALKMAQGRRTPDRQSTPERPSRTPLHDDVDQGQPSSPTAKGSFLSKVKTSASKISTSAAHFKPFSVRKPSTPTYGFDKDAPTNSIVHEDASLKLGAGYRAPQQSRALEKNTLTHDDEKLRLGIKYHTQGHNE